NIAETLRRILNGKWIRPQDYVSTDTLFYATNRALAAIGQGLVLITRILSLNFDYLLISKKDCIFASKFHGHREDAGSQNNQS
ncbi:MAG: hypothetical protein LBL07_20090, partial [Tannerella sp.]|nr:hypothetical protein [Tannerella sp.]